MPEREETDRSHPPAASPLPQNRRQRIPPTQHEFRQHGTPPPHRNITAKPGPCTAHHLQPNLLAAARTCCQPGQAKEEARPTGSEEPQPNEATRVIMQRAAQDQGRHQQPEWQGSQRGDPQHRAAEASCDNGVSSNTGASCHNGASGKNSVSNGGRGYSGSGDDSAGGGCGGCSDAGRAPGYANDRANGSSGVHGDTSCLLLLEDEEKLLVVPSLSLEGLFKGRRMCGSMRTRFLKEMLGGIREADAAASAPASLNTAKIPEVVTVEGMDINPDEFHRAGWTTALGAQRKRDPARSAVAAAAAETNASAAKKPGFNARAYAVSVVNAHGSLVNAATVVTNFTHEAEETAIAEPLSFTRTPEHPYELFRRPSSLQKQLRLSTNFSAKKGEKKIFRPHIAWFPAVYSRVTWETFPDLLTATQTSGHTNLRELTFRICGPPPRFNTAWRNLDNKDPLVSYHELASSNAKWILNVQWQMEGVDIHVDVGISKALSALFRTLTALTGEGDEGESPEEQARTAQVIIKPVPKNMLPERHNNGRVARAKELWDEYKGNHSVAYVDASLQGNRKYAEPVTLRHACLLLDPSVDAKKRSRLIEKEMNEQAKIISDLRFLGASQSTIEQEERRLKELETAVFNDFRRDVIKKLRRQSVKIRDK
ncbi:hypothetical protein HPB50_013556 [Hyalomma asiaticum]|uniref:Uncharacterized protein n=1 Tax=Hyalomma asiaticum TaxID=266040 RepID=A0ACB7SQ17_HYAAI|nr:hypothetical protein HPB50_013556 [Hyalomma asiaticum]